MRKICPTCRRRYTELQNFCARCGIRLEKEPNRCSAERTALCKSSICDDEDLYCTYCGAPTIYAKELLTEQNSY